MEKPGNTLDSAAIPLLTKAPQIVLLLHIDIWVSSISRKCSMAQLESENFRSSIILEGAILLCLANYCPLRWGKSWAPGLLVELPVGVGRGHHSQGLSSQVLPMQRKQAEGFQTLLGVGKWWEAVLNQGGCWTWHMM